MQSNAFKRASALVSPAKEVKAHLRLLPRKTQTALVFQGIVDLNVSVAGLQTSLRDYVLGSQLNKEVIEAAKDHMGYVFWSLFALAKALKVKVPAGGKKLALKGETFTECLLRIHDTSAELLAGAAEVLDGQHLTDKYELDEETLATLTERVESLILATYTFTYSVLKVLPMEIFDAHYARMVEVYGEEKFAPKASLKPEEEAQAE